MQSPSNMINTEQSEMKKALTDTMKGSTERALIMQRRQRLHALVQKRKANLSYLMKAHEGGVFWLNCVLLSKDDIRKYRKTVPKHRTLMYYSLAASNSSILSLPSGAVTVKAFIQLLEEWEYFFAGSAMQSMKFVLARNSPCMYPVTPIYSMGNNEDNELKPPSINKFDNVVVYEFLNATNVPFEMDYVEVLVGLCDSVVTLYDKFLCEECFKSASIYDGIMKIDAKIKHHIISLLAKELTELSTTILKSELLFRHIL